MGKKNQKIQPLKSTSKLKSYYCPHCQKLILKGDVKKLNMTCHNCNKLINADANELLKSEILNQSDTDFI